jgi:hypothetical protein
VDQELETRIKSYSPGNDSTAQNARMHEKTNIPVKNFSVDESSSKFGTGRGHGFQLIRK